MKMNHDIGHRAVVLMLLAVLGGCAAPATEAPAEEELASAPVASETAEVAASEPEDVEASEPAAPAHPAESDASTAHPAESDAGEAPAPTPPKATVEMPVGTILPLELLSALDSSVNRTGDEIQARTTAPLYVEGEQVLGSGALVTGRVTEVQASGRVKGRATLGLTFDRLETGAGAVAIRTSFVEKQAESGAKKDAAVIGGSAGVGAIVGGIIGGKKGAAIGATIGGAGGTGVVLSTRGEEIRLPTGTELNVRLDEPAVVEKH